MLGSELLALLVVDGEPKASRPPEGVACERRDPVDGSFGPVPDPQSLLIAYRRRRHVEGGRRPAQREPTVAPARTAGDLARLVQPHPEPALGERQGAGAPRHASADDDDLGGVDHHPGRRRRLLVEPVRDHRAIVLRYTPSSASHLPGELELDERGRHSRRLEPRRTSDLVARERPVTQHGQHRDRLVRHCLGRRFDRHEPVRLEHVTGARDRCRTQPQEPVRARRERARDLPGHCHHLPSVLEREVGGDQRARPLARLDDDGRGAQPGDHAVASRKPPRRGLDARLVLGDEQPVDADATRELGVRCRVVTVDAAAEHGHCTSTGSESAPVRLRVDAPSEPAHDHEARLRQLPCEPAGDGASVSRARARPHDRHGRLREEGLRAVAAHPKARWRIGDRGQQGRVLEVAASQRVTAHAAGSSVGERYESASATCSGTTASTPASNAIVLATRATRARPRPESDRRSTARSSSSEAAGESARRWCLASTGRLDDAGTDGRRRLARRRSELGGSRARHGHDEVEAIEERPRDALAVRLHALGRAGAIACPTPAAATRAEVHRGHEPEPGREARPAPNAGDRHLAVLERLPQRLEQRPGELRQLVEQQHAAMGEADLAGAGRHSASDHRGRARTVVRCPEGRLPDERPSDGEHSSDRVDARDLECLVAGQRREDRRQPPGKHRLSRPRGPGEQQVVPSRQPRSRARGVRAPARARPRGRGPPMGRPEDRVPPRARSARRRAGTRRPGRGAGRAPRRCRRELPRGPSRRRRGAARHRRDVPPPPRPASPTPGGSCRRAPSSPTQACCSRGPAGSCCDAPSTASAIERSKPEPSLRSPAGARLTVMRWVRGHSSSDEMTPLCTRCRASWQARSAMPTIENAGNSAVRRCASTSTRRGSSPTTAYVWARASTRSTLETLARRHWRGSASKQRRSATRASS